MSPSAPASEEVYKKHKVRVQPGGIFMEIARMLKPARRWRGTRLPGGHLLRRVMGESAEDLLAKRETAMQQAMRVANEVGQDRIIFEVSPLRELNPRRTLQFWLVSVFGPEVNLGNVRLEELGFLEAVRSGSHPAHGFGQAGDYPWIRAVETRKDPDYKWWARRLRSDDAKAGKQNTHVRRNIDVDI